MAEPLLMLSDIVAGYGRQEVLHGISLQVRPAEIVGVIGPNGAGKSTVLKTALGYLRPWRGTIEFRGRDISHLPTHEIIRLGVSYAPQGRVVFPGMTVREHLEMGAWTVVGGDRHRAALARVFALFPELHRKRESRARALSGGERQMLSLARSLMVDPQLLLVDEPSVGLAPRLVDQVFQKIIDLRTSGVAILLVEQNAARALEISDTGYVLEMGVIRYAGSGRELLTDARVRRLYLGG